MNPSILPQQWVICRTGWVLLLWYGITLWESHSITHTHTHTYAHTCTQTYPPHTHKCTHTQIDLKSSVLRFKIHVESHTCPSEDSLPLYLCIYQTLYKRKVKMMTVVEGDPKAPLSIATTPRCRGWRYSFPGLLHFALIMLSVKQGGINYNYFFLVVVMTRPGIEPRSPVPLANTLPC